jgi:hypothetical protein
LASVARAQNPPQRGFFADVQMLWFDSEVNDAFKLSPRFVAGYDDVVGARVRYWTFDNSGFNPIAAVTRQDGFGFQSLDLDVVDLEATTHIRHDGSDFLFSGGARIAGIHWHHFDSVVFHRLDEKTTLGGVTVAAEGRTTMLAREAWGSAFVYGGRLSMLEGEWSTLVGVPSFGDFGIQNERFIVPEVFTGVELNYGRLFTRLSVEMQDWRAESDGHNFGFTGYGFDLGYRF